MTGSETREQLSAGRPEDGVPALRFSSKRPVGFGWGVFAVFVLLTAMWVTGLVLIPFTMPNVEGVLFGVLYVVAIPVTGYGMLTGLAMTRPWWTTEVRGSTYVIRTSYFARNNKRYDLASVTRVAFGLENGEGNGYSLRVRLEFPADRGEIRIYLLPGDRRDRLQYRPHLRAIADALAQHPQPDVTEKAVATLRMLAGASDSDLAGLLKTWRASSRARRRAGRQS